MVERTESRRSESGGTRAGEPLPRTAQTFGRYLLLRKLAAGGMAEIFLAKQTGISGFERLVVVKRILPHLSNNREFITMFLDEARTAAQLSHPNIVQIYDLGQIDQSYYLAMEYIHGEDLRRVYNQEVQRGSRIAPALGAHMVAQAAQGLDYAHRKVDISGVPLNLVHRDISPQNLLVSYDGHVKVVDFGVAKAAKNEALTRSGVLKGKYSYMSPEQAQGMKIDARSDVFALAVVLYEVTTGERLFKRANELETLHAVIACEVPLPTKLDPSYPQALERIILKALQKNPSRRQQSAGELARELEEFVRSTGKGIGPSELSSYLQELFADKLAEELLMGSGLWEEDHTHLEPRARAVKKARVVRSDADHALPDDEGEDNLDSAADAEALASAEAVDALGDAFPQEPSDHSLPQEGSQAFIGSLRSNEASGERGEEPRRRGSNPSSHSPARQQDESRSDSFDRARGGRDWATPSHSRPQRRAFVDLDVLTQAGETAPGPRSSTGTMVHRARAGGARALGRAIVFIGFTSVGLVAVALWAANAGLLENNSLSGPITLKTRPEGATAFVDGLKVSEGVTPLTLRALLAPGAHHVRFERDGFEPAEGDLLAVAASKTTFELDLHPVPEEPPRPVASEHLLGPPRPAINDHPIAAPPQPRRDEPSVPHDEPVIKTGTLVVKSALALNVYRGKTLLGTTPLSRAMPEGTYGLRLEYPPSGWTESRKVVVEAGAAAHLDVVLPTGKLRVNIVPFGNIKLGSYSGETPMAPIEVPAGIYTLHVWNHELGKDEMARVQISPGRETGFERNWVQ